MVRHTFQISILATAVLLINACLSHRLVHLRFTLWLVVLIKCLVPPVWPATFGFFCERVVVHDNAIPQVMVNVSGVSVNAADGPVTAIPSATHIAVEGASFESGAPWRDWLIPCLYLLWLSVASGMLFSLFYRAVACVRRARLAAVETPDWLLEVFEAMRLEIGCRPTATLVVTSANVGAAIAGLFRPCVSGYERKSVSTGAARMLAPWHRHAQQNHPHKDRLESRFQPYSPQICVYGGAVL
jgi:hypothetical protein